MSRQNACITLNVLRPCAIVYQPRQHLRYLALLQDSGFCVSKCACSGRESYASSTWRSSCLCQTCCTLYEKSRVERLWETESSTRFSTVTPRVFNTAVFLFVPDLLDTVRVNAYGNRVFNTFTLVFNPARLQHGGVLVCTRSGGLLRE